MKKTIATRTVLVSTLATAFLCGCPNDKPKTTEEGTTAGKPAEVPPPEFLAIAATDSTPALWNIKGTIWLQNENEFYYKWTSLSEACPAGFRVPTVDEFKNAGRLVQELTNSLNGYTENDSLQKQGEEGYWWTLNVAAIQDSLVPPTVTAAKLTKDSKTFEFVEEPFDLALKVRCVQDSSTDFYAVNPTPMKLDSLEGFILDAHLTPYYEGTFENMGCADCCCEEGNGGELNVAVRTDEGIIDSIKVLELDPKFCGTIVMSGKEAATPKVVKKNGCLLAKMENFSILPLFQPGTSIKYSSCASRIYVKSIVGDENPMVTCGENIQLNFEGVLQEIALVQKENADEEKECSYTIKLASNGKNVTTQGPCSNAVPGVNYDIQVSVVLDGLTGKKESPILDQEYPCCYGETRSFQIGDIQFTEAKIQPAAKPNTVVASAAK